MMFKTTYLTRLTDVDTTDRESIGTLRFESGKMYKYVKYNHGVGELDLVVGNVVGYFLNGADDYVVTADVSSMDTLPVIAGIIVAATVTVDDSYIWIQIGGPGTLATTVEGTTPAAGDVICILTGTTDKYAEIDPTANNVVTGGFMVTTTTGVILTCPW